MSVRSERLATAALESLKQNLARPSTEKLLLSKSILSEEEGPLRQAMLKLRREQGIQESPKRCMKQK